MKDKKAFKRTVQLIYESNLGGEIITPNNNFHSSLIRCRHEESRDVTDDDNASWRMNDFRNLFMIAENYFVK